MPPLITDVLSTMRRRQRSHDARSCVTCGRRIDDGEAELKLRGMRVHRRCATYRMRRRDATPS